jgi:hypothetical protein
LARKFSASAAENPTFSSMDRGLPDGRAVIRFARQSLRYP